jgi:hypothetical protein
MRNRTKEVWMLIGWIFVAALTRLLPHPANFTPIAAIALFGGAHFGSARSALAVALGAMLVSDAGLELLSGRGFHDQMLWVYGSFAATVWLGGFLRSRRRVVPVMTASLVASMLFFLVTNFGVWAAGTLYPRTIAGLAACFVAALPFFGRTLLGDLLYAGLLFGSFAWAGARRAPSFVSTSCSGGSATR